MDECLHQRIRFLEHRVAELEERVRSLRLGRRILLNLLQQLEGDYRRKLARVQSELTVVGDGDRRHGRLLWMKRADS